MYFIGLRVNCPVHRFIQLHGKILRKYIMNKYVVDKSTRREKYQIFELYTSRQFSQFRNLMSECKTRPYKKDKVYQSSHTYARPAL